MSWFKEHPLAVLGVGLVLGVVFYSQIKRIPGASKLPQV